MSHLPSTRDLLRSAGITPRKSLGQNFLMDDHIARRIAAAAQIEDGDIVIEIGPGIGALTRHLVAQAGSVFAIEIDRHLLPLLQSALSDAHNLTIVQADALEVDFAGLLQGAGHPPRAPVRFVGNLPYYITSAVIRRMLEAPLDARSIVLMVQLEVAQRMIAQPGDMSLLALSVQFYGRPELLMRVGAGAFYPQPDVDSAVVRITPHSQRYGDAHTLFALARAGFGQRRKQLRNTLVAGMNLPRASAEALLTQAGIDYTRRAETLSLEEWARLAEEYHRSYGKENRSLNRSSASASSSGVAAPSAENPTEP